MGTKDLQREILSQVAAGKITAEEGAARLEALDAQSSVEPAAPTPVARVQAGNLRVQGVNGPIVADVQAGNCKLGDFRAPVKLTVMAGNIDAFGRIDSGESSIRCEMGQVKVGLARGSNVRINARTTMGKVAIEGDGMRKNATQVTVGSGAGSLDIECTMGNVKVVVG